jgi:hypothetical protein
MAERAIKRWPEAESKGWLARGAYLGSASHNGVSKSDALRQHLFQRRVADRHFVG